ncbi:MAG: DEAD/DEAH box helicase [Pseudomonadota bacterium]
MTGPVIHALPTPGLFWGDYPERTGRPSDDWIQPWLRHFNPGVLARGRYQRFAARALAEAERMSDLGPEAVRMRLAEWVPDLARLDRRDQVLVKVFGLVLRTCQRTLGLTPYPVQVAAARALLDNTLVELATGEGKTLAIGLASALGALSGMPVHVITANDYLVARDAAALAPLHDALGLSVGQVTAGLDQDQRRSAYACDITYCTAKELGFDYLRDRQARSRASRLVGRWAGQPPKTRLRGLCMAILDEADSLLIDEATVPLVLGVRSADPARRVDPLVALHLAAALNEGRDYRVDPEARGIELTEAGHARLETLTGLSPAWRNRLFRRAWVIQALRACHLFQRDRDYLVIDDTVVIIDPTTGRVAPGRAWSHGLHGLIAAKEGLRPPAEQDTVARITYPRLFRRYHRLSGISGTLVEAAGELVTTYGTPVLRLPSRRPGQLRIEPPRVHVDRASLWQAVAERVAVVHRQGRPVLVGTDSVADSEALAALLRQSGLACQVLNARQDQAEAEIVGQAGQPGRITVATNMAGRGTDIPLGEGVAELGGLHLIACQHNPARRIDRQLHGRCARQGQPGSLEIHLCLEADLLRGHFAQPWLDRLARQPGRHRWIQALYTLAQRAAEAEARRTRRALAREESVIEQGLAFGGEME